MQFSLKLLQVICSRYLMSFCKIRLLTNGDIISYSLFDTTVDAPGWLTPEGPPTGLVLPSQNLSAP